MRGKEKKIKDNRKKVKKINKRKSNHNINIFKVNGEFKVIPLLMNILIPVLGGVIIGYLNKNTMNTYEMLKKPIFTPPNNVFPIVWTILYLLMGVAAYRVYMRNKQGADDKGAYFFYLVQLMFNFMWSFIFFTFRLYGIAFIWLVVLFILVLITFIKFIRVDKIAAILLIPYMIWLMFAGILNFFIWMFNEM
ncbi:tryptophan-rich sensory protein [Clostridium septicum]|uniref:Tryptophan-rich sensory protein n=1 Tax=Clostridium septicum TaxID=1504 RepID=A0A9N7PK26_CLOSE|nr:tryptophan-rich sensory protein [Clostridium septicum]QAS60799.1 tryptophan-rich sensory protein [Clostridium septicum]